MRLIFTLPFLVACGVPDRTLPVNGNSDNTSSGSTSSHHHNSGGGSGDGSGDSDNTSSGSGDSTSSSDGEILELCAELDQDYDNVVLYAINEDPEHWNNDQWFDGSSDPVAVDDDSWICGWLRFPLYPGDYTEVNGEYDDGYLVKDDGYGGYVSHIIQLYVGDQMVNMLFAPHENDPGADLGFTYGGDI